MDALCKEITLPQNFIEDKNIETVYIGGGTPSLLTPAELQQLFTALRQKFVIANDAEITLEANPDDINPAILQEWLDAGINRLSVGLQSFNETELKWMNRAHNAAQSLQCLDDIKAAGFTNYSADLIYGSPLQTNDDLIKNFKLIAEKGVPHISCYALTVEPKTALNKLIAQHKSPATDPEKQADQFALLLQLMEKERYEQYEISNFSKPGYRSKHNSSYWQGKPYFGFGPAAHSFDGEKRRRWNIANNAVYIQSLENDIIPFEEETLTDDQRLNEYIMTALRTAEGINTEYLKNTFGEINSARVMRKAGKYLRDAKLTMAGTHLKLTPEGKFLADGIAANLFV